MATLDDVQYGDIGTIFRLTLKDDGVVVDLSSATLKQIKLNSPSGITSTNTAAFYSDGTDGIIQYVSVDGDLDEAGVWEIQAYIEMTGWEGHSSKGGFRVSENL